MTWRQKYAKYMRSSTWRNKREEAFAYHGRRCACCNSTEALCVHHLTYRTYNREPGQELMKELLPLCEDHHKLVHALINEFVYSHKDDYRYNWDKASKEAINYLLKAPKTRRVLKRTSGRRKKTHPKKMRSKASSRKRKELNKLNRGIGCAKGSQLRYIKE